MESLEGGIACFHIHPPSGAGIGKCASGSYAGWHTFGSNWGPGVVTYYYDGKEIGQVKSSNIDSTPQYLVTDLLSGETHGQPLVLPSEMLVDYVRVWQHPRAPEVTTGSASVTGAEATLSGSVTPNGIETGYAFEYGETTSYGYHSQPEGKVPEGWSSTPVSAKIANLIPGKTYHYRVVASSSAGGANGADHTFRVEAPSNLLTNASFGYAAPACALPQGWTMRGNGGSVSECSYVSEERAQQGNV
ncbi:MAG TPA: hypothetical protein VHU13_08105, partial [Solirubrobacteraceae bacterium]|nr:hypothetical protein [Solirubrobacteraceae bacterium]